MVIILIAVAWPKIARAITSDEVSFYNSPTEHTALFAAVDPFKAPKRRVEATYTPKQDMGVMERIAACESKNVATAKNPRSSASGRFQFLKSSWEYYGKQKWGTLEGKDVFNYEQNTELAYWVYEREGVTPWLASKYCWG